jgi:hypothetical protein
VLKKILKAATTFFLLVGCYFGYVRLFGIVVEQLRASHRPDHFIFAVRDSKSKRESIAYAKATFGPNHWSAAEDLAYRYYNADRGFWIYAREWERVIEENGVRYDGKRMRLRPFALIMKSRDGKNTKCITSDRAILDLNEPLGFNVNSSAEPIKIKHAHLEPNVEVRDDKSTPEDPNDDMHVGPLTTVDYEESTQQITTDSHVVIEDPDIVTTGDGMLIQLRKDDLSLPSGSSSGFDGAERMELNKNVHVVMRDVGKSGMLSGPQGSHRMPGQKDRRNAVVASGVDQKAPQAKSADEPTPLDLSCESKMQVHFPKPQLPVLIGPPSPPLPTLVQFDRNVVLLRGPLDGRPDQLTCDNLILSLIPADRPNQPVTPPPTRRPERKPPFLSVETTQDPTTVSVNSASNTTGQTVAQSESVNGSSTDRTSQSKAEIEPGGTEKQGIFANLTLQRAHATGHAVWLYLPAQGVKLKCNQLIHTRFAPYKPDTTYFRGDLPRPLDLWKIDVAQAEGPDQGKVTSVTHVKTVDATMYDNGNGMGAANVVANGPGRLETQPDLDQPIERIAIWQDKLYLHNEVGSDGQVLQKIVVLTGNRPCFIDKLQETSLDSGQWIRVWLKPRPESASTRGAETALSQSVERTEARPAVSARSTGMGGVVATMVSSPRRDNETHHDKREDLDSGPSGGNFQIERLWALKDVHLIAPAKTMTARQWLDAEFINTAPAAVDSTQPTKGNSSSSTTTGSAGQAQEPGEKPAPDPEEVVAQDQPEKPPPEPPMVGLADRIWAKLEITPKSRDGREGRRLVAQTNSTTSTKAGAASTRGGPTESNTEIRKVWMWGSVSLHQDPEPDKTKGQDASGEALYLDNRGQGKIITEIYQRDPNEKTYLPGPLPPARVENQDMKITAAGKLKMDQDTDRAWVEGPGTLTQISSKPSITPVGGGSAASRPVGVEDTRAGRTPSQALAHTSAVRARNDAEVHSRGAASLETAGASRSQTRAGRPVNGNAPTTIAFSERMEFTGRTTDPDGHPAARADFYGIVTAQMEDALLHCEEKMIGFTDRVVPLAQLGEMSRSRSTRKAREDLPESPNSEGEASNQPQLALLYCYRKVVGINRKVDADTPTLLEKRRVEADDILAYDRRTGDFTIPGKGVVYLYDRSDNSSRAPGMSVDTDRDESRTSSATPRTITPTSRRAQNQPSRSTGGAVGTTRRTPSGGQPRAVGESKDREFPPLVLSQIYFNKEMRGRIATGQEDEKLATNWYEFFGDIQFARAKVPDSQSTLNFDKLPSDGLFLTSQTLRVRTEPPPVGSPPSAPARDYVKAWEKAYVWSSDKSLQSDVITYDSDKDLVYAFGEQGRGVIYAQQHATGQPSSTGTAKAVRLNPKTGAMHFIDNASVQLIDKNSGSRPDVVKPSDPDAKTPKPPRRPFRLPSGNVERRGFSGQ